MKAEITEGLINLRKKTQGKKWFIVSGGDQTELRELFKERNISDYFDGGIYGSPDTKEQILLREKQLNHLLLPSLFFGDSRVDHIASKSCEIDFIFISGWSDFQNYKNYCRDNDLQVYNNLQDVLPNK